MREKKNMSLKILNTKPNGETEFIGTYTRKYILPLNPTIANCIDSCDGTGEADVFVFKNMPSKALEFAMRYCEHVAGCDSDADLYRWSKYIINPMFTKHAESSKMDDLFDLLKLSFFLENKCLSECTMRMIIHKKNSPPKKKTNL